MDLLKETIGAVNESNRSISLPETNKLIAEFMGGKMKVENYNGINIIEIDNKTFDLYGLRYHLSWDWLIPVVEKVFQTHLIELEDGDKYIMQINDALLTINISEVYSVVIEFIKWYNQNK